MLSPPISRKLRRDTGPGQRFALFFMGEAITKKLVNACVVDRPAIGLRKEAVYRNPSSKERPELPQGNLQRLFNRTATQFDLLAGVAFQFYQCDHEA